MVIFFLTGGAGFIGSHTAVELLEAGCEVVLADDLSNSEISVIDRIETITGKRPVFYQADVTDRAAVEAIFSVHSIDAVIHFAGFKAVWESVQKPVAYYSDNIDSALTVLEVMKAHDCPRYIFSFSATVYGLSDQVPFTEKTETRGCTNPYFWTKYMIEQILRDAVAADKALSVVLLRYFNPIGAHPSGLLGKKPSGTPTILCPISRRWPRASGITCLCSETTIPRRTAPACGTTSTSKISPKAIWRPIATHWSTAAARCSISAPAWATACWIWCALLSG